LYPIEYYRVEVSASQSFQSLVGNTTCRTGQTNNLCNFDEGLAIVTGLTKAQVYYFRVLGGTIIGDGQNSTAVISQPIAGGPGPPAAVSLRSDQVSSGVVNYFFSFREPTDTGTGDGLSTLPVLSYLVQVSTAANFSTVAASATLDNNHPGGLQKNMTWSPQVHPSGWAALGRTYFLRVRAQNLFNPSGAVGDYSAVLSRKLLKESSDPVSLRSDQVSSGVVNYFFSFRETTDTGTGEGIFYQHKRMNLPCNEW
jgi:hypothetical protein